jgi:predicted phosphodiesterase
MQFEPERKECAMKIAIISDIHGNFDALSQIPEKYDQLWVLGDLVNYGPQPAEVIQFVRERAAFVVRGNHDHCIGFGEDPRCSVRFREMAEATRKYTESILTDEDKRYLRDLPLQQQVWLGETCCRLCHAVPSDPLFTYCPPDSPRWVDECKRVRADLLLVGHTHLQFGLRVGSTLVVNPGSLGQAKSGESVASYAVLRDGRLGFRSFHYPVERTVEKIREMGIPAAIQDDLIAILRTGSVPEEQSEAAHVENIGD